MEYNITKKDIKKYAETCPDKKFAIIYLTRNLLNEFEKTEKEILEEYEEIEID